MNIIKKRTNKNAIIKKLVKLIDPSNTNGDSNHPSLVRITITLTRVQATPDLISNIEKPIEITISKTGGISSKIYRIWVKKN